MTYEELTARLFSLADERYRIFHTKLLKNDKLNVIGVRMPQLRRLAGELRGEEERLLNFPDVYYEVTFLKCAAAGRLPFAEFTLVVDRLVSLLDNWATCDSFIAPCVAGNREAFLPFVRKYLADGAEFTVRYGLVTLLRFYMEKQYLPEIFTALKGCGDEPYYVMTGGAWLLSEVLAVFYDDGVRFINEAPLTPRLGRTAIRKARESFRLTPAEKDALLAYESKFRKMG